MKYHLPILISTLFFSNASGQEMVRCEYSFAQMKKGEITLSQLLSDSVTFECSSSNEEVEIGGFSLATKCDGVTRFFKNENDGFLNNVMKEDVKRLKPGCLIEFSSIMLWPKRGRKGFNYSTSAENLKFKLK